MHDSYTAVVEFTIVCRCEQTPNSTLQLANSLLGLHIPVHSVGVPTCVADDARNYRLLAYLLATSRYVWLRYVGTWYQKRTLTLVPISEARLLSVLWSRRHNNTNECTATASTKNRSYQVGVFSTAVDLKSSSVGGRHRYFYSSVHYQVNCAYNGSLMLAETIYAIQLYIVLVRSKPYSITSKTPSARG